MYQMATRLTDILNYPLPDRIRSLVICFETAPSKDLQHFFPTLVHNIFGYQENIGWGLRTITEQSGDISYFRILYEFFHPHGAFMQLVYRLLKDSIKYEIKLSELPIKLRQILESGSGRPNSSFYTNLFNADNFQPKNMGLSLNAFEFYVFHFAIHGMKNFHKTSQAALNVNNENSKTVYFTLVADFLCNFLPSDPNAIIYPQIEGASGFKPQSTMSPQQLTTSKPPKYLMLSKLTHQIQNPTSTKTDLRISHESAKSSNWRSETIMIVFIDIWLRGNDIDDWELPGNEFIRMVRILVKQLHGFGNVAEQDFSSLSILRQQAQPMLSLRIYPFLKTIISRWPLDTSFVNVLELWLSFVQPWRYIYNRNIANLNNEMVEIPDRFKSFISENLACYTQIFVRLIPRFLKMDLSLSKNAYMLFRMLKVFRQPSEILRELEKNIQGNGNNSSTMRTHNSSFNESSIHSSPPRTSSSFNRSSPHHHRSTIEDSNYIFMFSDDITMQVYELMQRLYVTKLRMHRDVEKMEKEVQKQASAWEKFMRFIGWISSLSLSFSMALEEKKKTPIYLDFCLNVLSPVYDINIEDATREFERHEGLIEDSDDEHETLVGSEFLNITPSFMKQQRLNMSYTGDPFLLPIMSHEIKFLVRFFHVVSSKINEMFDQEFDVIYHRDDMYGKVSRQILSPPVETKTFDKSAGYPVLVVKQIGPRLSLRKLASWSTLITLVFSLMFGRLFLGASSLGFITLSILFFGFLMTKAIISQ